MIQNPVKFEHLPSAARQAIEAAAVATDTSPSEILSPLRNSLTVDARCIAIWILRSHDIPLRLIASWYGWKPNSIYHHVHRFGDFMGTDQKFTSMFHRAMDQFRANGTPPVFAGPAALRNIKRCHGAELVMP